MRPFPLSSPEMGEAAIGGVRTSNSTVLVLTLMILAL